MLVHFVLLSAIASALPLREPVSGQRKSPVINSSSQNSKRAGFRIYNSPSREFKPSEYSGEMRRSNGNRHQEQMAAEQNAKENNQLFPIPSLPIVGSLPVPSVPSIGNVVGTVEDIVGPLPVPLLPSVGIPSILPEGTVAGIVQDVVNALPDIPSVGNVVGTVESAVGQALGNLPIPAIGSVTGTVTSIVNELPGMGAVGSITGALPELPSGAKSENLNSSEVQEIAKSLHDLHLKRLNVRGHVSNHQDGADSISKQASGRPQAGVKPFTQSPTPRTPSPSQPSGFGRLVAGGRPQVQVVGARPQPQVQAAGARPQPQVQAAGGRPQIQAAGGHKPFGGRGFNNQRIPRK